MMWITALVVVGRDTLTSVILFNIVGDIIVADFSETVVVMDPADVTSMCGILNVVGAVLVADF